jgi:hypothetical protein
MEEVQRVPPEKRDCIEKESSLVSNHVFLRRSSGVWLGTGSAVLLLGEAQTSRQFGLCLVCPGKRITTLRNTFCRTLAFSILAVLPCFDTHVDPAG